jgi:hypothetical protein
MEEAILIPAIFNLTASKYYDFILPLFDLEFDVDDYTYESGIFNAQGEKVGEFLTTIGIDELLFTLRTDELEAIPIGEYSYYVGKISKEDTAWHSPVVKGKFTRID